MPYRRKDSPVWWVSFTDSRGKRIRRTTETEDRREAEALEAKWKLESYRSRHWEEAPEVTFEEVMLSFLKHRADKRSARTDRLHARRLTRSFAGRGMSGLCGGDITGYIRLRHEEGVSDTTINRELALLSAAINRFNCEFDRLLPNPTKGRKMREPEGRLRWLTKAEAGTLVAAAQASPTAPHLAPLILLALHTGMRQGEMLNLEWSRVDLIGNQLYLEGIHTKAKKRRTIPLNAVARSALLEQARFRAVNCPASPWVFTSKKGKRLAGVRTSFEKACKVADIEDFRFHDLRHTCAAWLVQKRVPLAEVRDLLGHSTVQVTERYAHLAPENTRSAVNRLTEPESRSGHVEKIEEGKMKASD